MFIGPQRLHVRPVVVCNPELGSKLWVKRPTEAKKVQDVKGVDGQTNSLKQVLRVHGQSTNQLATQECESNKIQLYCTDYKYL